jgi:hypothetical protein
MMSRSSASVAFAAMLLSVFVTRCLPAQEPRPSSAGVSPVALGSREAGLEWWITSVDAQPERTVVTLKVMNTDKIQEVGMYAFDGEPLAMFDNQWAFCPMRQAPAVPAGVRVQPWGQSRTMWWIQPQRVLTLEVVFAPLAPNATGGRLLYLQAPNGSNTTPAEFALQNRGPTAK